MAKLWFRYGAMGSSKTANALMVAFNYEERGLKPLVLKPKLENRDGERIIKSRIGISRECGFVEDYIFPDSSVKWATALKDYDCVIIDEVQFCSVEQIDVLRQIVDEIGIPVLCYGLKDDFLLNPFPASERLLALADRLEEIKTVCWCGQGATCNARINEKGEIVRSGKQIELGGNDKYISLCRKHYFSGQTKKPVV